MAFRTPKRSAGISPQGINRLRGSPCLYRVCDICPPLQKGKKAVALKSPDRHLAFSRILSPKDRRENTQETQTLGCDLAQRAIPSRLFSFFRWQCLRRETALLRVWAHLPHALVCLPRRLAVAYQPGIAFPQSMIENPRRSSFGMLLRRKSGDMKKGKKAQQARDAEMQRQQAAVAAQQPPPKLPQLYNGLREPVFETRDSVAIFGPDTPRSYSQQQQRTPPRQQQQRGASMDAPRAISANVPIPPIPSNGGNYIDPYARTESMTNRGRYSYASSSISTVNNPRKVRRRKDPTPFK